jgi:wyosine [tRNA(Phe)-imidazoG37] synthetase (radical SAM superfamily)
MTRLTTPLNTTDHSRDIAGLTYVYPVISRRAGGVSVGVNLNPNNACNWRCIYCQVPNLTRGAAPRIDLPRLEQELRGLLREIVQGGFMEDYVPREARRFNDIALSGNGEPTSAKEFEAVIELIGRLMEEFALLGKVKLVLITNGSLLGRANVQRGLMRMATLGGEVWFKIDSATREGMRRINGTEQTPAKTLKNLELAAGRCPTWVQTCVFALDGAAPSQEERAAYLALLQRAREHQTPLRGVLLYGLARPSMQPEAARLAPLPVEWLEDFAAEVRRLGLEVKVTL